MAYQLRGTYFESCNCDVACPCGASNLRLPATNERCTVLLASTSRTARSTGRTSAVTRWPCWPTPRGR